MSHQGGMLASPRGKSLISIGFYKVSQLTISFCSSQQGPHGLRGGLAVVGSRKCLFPQRFPMGRTRWLLGAHLGTKCHPGFLWWRKAVLHFRNPSGCRAGSGILVQFSLLVPRVGTIYWYPLLVPFAGTLCWYPLWVPFVGTLC